MYNKYGIFLILSLIITVSACYDENNTFGQNLVESVFTTVRVDTNTVEVTLMKMDSVETSGTSTILVGKYEHPVWGEITASSYLPFSYPSIATDRSVPIVYDSLTLSINFNTYFIGDTLKPYTLHVHRLKDKVRLDDNGYLYNTSTFPYEEEPMTSRTFYPRPNMQEIDIRMSLDDEFGEELLSALHRRDDAVSSSRFEDFFQGLVFVPDEENQSIITYLVNDTSTVMTLHYHLRSDPTNAVDLNIKVNTDKQFNNFVHDRTGTILEDIEMRNIEISSTELGNRGMVFGGLGWYSRLDFPHINNLMWTGQQIEVESAYLKFYPELGTFSEFNALPDSIYLYIADRNNVITDVVSDYLGSEVQVASLVDDRTQPDQTYFYFDITDFIQQEMGTAGYYKHNLQLVFNSDTYITTFKNLTFGDKNYRNPLTLDITYKIYEKY